MAVSQKEVETQDRVAEYYEDKRYSTFYSIDYQKEWSRDMIKLVPDIKGVILDNGCGTGNFAEELTAEQRKHTIGSDISIEMLKRAKKRLKKVVKADSQQLPFPNDSFDIVFSRSLLHHLPDPQAGADEVARVLKKGGYAVFVDTVDSLLSSLPRKITEHDEEHFSEEHKNFKRKEYLAMVGKGLKIKKVQYFGYVAYPLMGFPDIVDPFKFLPFKKALAPALRKFDKLIQKIPVINKQAWGVMVLAQKE